MKSDARFFQFEKIKYKHGTITEKCILFYYYIEKFSYIVRKLEKETNAIIRRNSVFFPLVFFFFQQRSIVCSNSIMSIRRTMHEKFYLHRMKITAKPSIFFFNRKNQGDIFGEIKTAIWTYEIFFS